MIDNIKTDHNFHYYINPERKVETSAVNIHGITNEFLNDKPKFKDIASEFINYIGDSELIIHNAQFDMSFINFELDNCGHKKISNKVIDTVLIARKEFPGQLVNLDSLCRKLNIKNINRNLHGALLDAHLLSIVYLKLTTGKQSSFDLSIANKRQDNKLMLSMNIKEKLSKRKLQILPEDEYKEHLNYLENMNNPIWDKIGKI